MQEMPKMIELLHKLKDIQLQHISSNMTRVELKQLFVAIGLSAEQTNSNDEVEYGGYTIRQVFEFSDPNSPGGFFVLAFRGFHACVVDAGGRVMSSCRFSMSPACSNVKQLDVLGIAPYGPIKYSRISVIYLPKCLKLSDWTLHMSGNEKTYMRMAVIGGIAVMASSLLLYLYYHTAVFLLESLIAVVIILCGIGCGSTRTDIRNYARVSLLVSIVFAIAVALICAGWYLMSDLTLGWAYLVDSIIFSLLGGILLMMLPLSRLLPEKIAEKDVSKVV